METIKPNLNEDRRSSEDSNILQTPFTSFNPINEHYTTLTNTLGTGIKNVDLIQYIYDDEFVDLINSLSFSIKEFFKHARKHLVEMKLSVDSIDDYVLSLHNIISGILAQFNPISDNFARNSYNKENLLKEKLNNFSESLDSMKDIKTIIFRNINDVEFICQQFYENAKVVFRKMKKSRNSKLVELNRMNNLFNITFKEKSSSTQIESTQNTPKKSKTGSENDIVNPQINEFISKKKKNLTSELITVKKKLQEMDHDKSTLKYHLEAVNYASQVIHPKVVHINRCDRKNLNDNIVNDQSKSVESKMNIQTQTEEEQQQKSFSPNKINLEEYLKAQKEENSHLSEQVRLLSQKLCEKETEISALMSEFNGLKEGMKDKTFEIEYLSKKKEDMNAMLDQSQKNNEKITSDFEKLLKEYEKLLAEVQSKEEKINQEKKLSKDLSEQLANINELYARLSTFCEDNKNSLDILDISQKIRERETGKSKLSIDDKGMWMLFSNNNSEIFKNNFHGIFTEAVIDANQQNFSHLEKRDYADHEKSEAEAKTVVNWKNLLISQIYKEKRVGMQRNSYNETVHKMKENEKLFTEQLKSVKDELKITREDRDKFKRKFEEAISIQGGNKDEVIEMLKQTFEKLIYEIHISGKVKEYVTMILRFLNYHESEIRKILDKKEKKSGFLGFFGKKEK